MLDKQGRILIQRDFKVFKSDLEEVHIYFSREENLYFILPEEIPNQFLCYVRKIDSKRRFYVPKDILDEYNVKQVSLGKKEGKIYIIPVLPKKGRVSQ